MSAAGVHTIPWAFLISPEGEIVASDNPMRLGFKTQIQRYMGSLGTQHQGGGQEERSAMPGDGGEKGGDAPAGSKAGALPSCVRTAAGKWVCSEP